MALEISQLSSSISILIAQQGISGNLIALVQGEQGEQGDQGLQGEAGVGLTFGGESGQYLVKVGTADYETAWATLSITAIGGVYVDSPADGQALIWDDANQYFTNRDVSGSSSSSSSSASTSIRVTQSAHGLTTGDVVYFDGASWHKALATSTSTLGIGVAQYVSSSIFNVIFSGQVSGFTGLSSGNYYFLSDSISGGLTYTEPSISNPLLFATSSTSGIVVPWRPVDISSISDDYINITGSTTLSEIVDSVYCNAASGVFNVNLMATSSIPGKVYTFKKLDSSANAVTILPNGSDTIEATASYSLTGQYTSLTIGNNGLHWYIHNIYRP